MRRAVVLFESEEAFLEFEWLMNLKSVMGGNLNPEADPLDLIGLAVLKSVYEGKTVVVRGTEKVHGDTGSEIPEGREPPVGD